MIKVSIIIKTLNEESNISRAIESALRAAASHRGEVIVADSGSTDRTVETAMRYPIVVVRLSDPEQQCCGVGPQLGFQHSDGEYVYVLDGDMELDTEFLQEAIEFLEHEPSIAGVGGIVREMRLENLEFENRARHFLRRQVKHGSDVDCLTGGGLYRRAAIDDVSYLSDQNLHGFEEYDLGARLRVRGWRLVRLESHAVDHYSPRLSTYRLLWYRLRAGRLLALGEILSAAIRGKYLKNALVELRPIRFAIGVLLYWPIAALLALATQSIGGIIAFLLFAAAVPMVVMTARSGSLKGGAYSVAVWHLTAINLLLGLFRTRKRPTAPIGSQILCTAGHGPTLRNDLNGMQPYEMHLPASNRRRVE
jgi:glycosyltransferase involved in cell wall biosynthesis